MIQFLVVLSVLFFSWTSLWAGPLIVGKGAGESEYAITFTRAYLPELLNQCVGPCQLNSDELLILKELIEAAKNPPSVEFKDDMQTEIFAYLSNTHQVWFNNNMLWQDLSKSKPIDEVIAIKLWINVLKQQLNMRKDLTYIQSELDRVLRLKMLSSTFLINLKQSFQAMTWVGDEGRLYIRDATYSSYDFTSYFLALTECKAPQKIYFFSLRWENVKQNTDGSLELNLSATQTWQCETQAHRGRVRLTLKALAPDYKIDLNSIRANREGE